MKKKKIVISIIGIFLVGAIGYSIYAVKNSNKYVSVHTSVAEKGNIESYLSTTGTIKSVTVKEYFGTQGKVKNIYVKVGDNVKKGQALIEFDVQDLTGSVKQAQLQYDNAVLSKQALNKLPSKAVTKEQLKQADNAISLAKVALDTAKSSSDKVKKTVYASKDGVVTNINVSVDSIYSGAQPSIITQDLDNLKLVVSVGKFDANKIKVGETATINDGNTDLKGKVSFVSPIAQKSVSVTGSDTTLSADIKIEEKSPLLKVEFDSDVEILIEQKMDIIKVPVEAIKQDKTGKNTVYIVQDGKAVEKEVELGIQSDADTEIISGLSEGDRVILNPNEKITDGQLIIESSERSK